MIIVLQLRTAINAAEAKIFQTASAKPLENELINMEDKDFSCNDIRNIIDSLRNYD